MAKYECPKCGEETRVLRTTQTGSVARRERVCKKQHRFDTYETPESQGILVVRASGAVEPFERQRKLENSIQLASVGTMREQVARSIADDVVHLLNPDARKPIPTAQIGDAVLKVLLTRAPMAAIRYATVFLGKRGRIRTPADLAQWIADNVPSTQRTLELNPWRPHMVVKHRKGNEPFGYGEAFSLVKLWRGIDKAVKGLGVNGQDHDPGTYDQSLGSVVAYVLEDLHGQPIVTSGQISASVLKVLRSVAPLAAMRYSIPTKSYTLPDAVRDECLSLTEFAPAPIDLSEFKERATELAEEVQQWERRVSSQSKSTRT